MQLYKDKGFIMSFFSGIFFLIISLIINFYASGYATTHASSFVTDIILSNTRVYDVDMIFVYGAILAMVFSAGVCLYYPRKAPFILKSVALFTIIRSIFISLTHISPFPSHVAISSVFFSGAYFQGIFTGDDLFFSGHTGLPFLIALMFWDNKIIRYIFLGFSALFAIVVLLGHLHYSIDVLSAFFITYSIFHICRFIFKKDWSLFLEK